jgi:hypothetical protein
MTAQIANDQNYFRNLASQKTSQNYFCKCQNQINQLSDRLSQEAENQTTAQMTTGQNF